MRRDAFFAAVRADPFSGSLAQSQVDGITAILDEWDRRKLTDLRHLAYMLATTFHETARTMLPIIERGPVSYFDRYEKRADLGNKVKGDGYKFRGRGFVQLTGRRNYSLASDKTSRPLIIDPDLALDPDIAAKVMFVGMAEGWFTTKKLSDYFHDGKADWKNARRIINGTDKAETIAGYGKAFYAALLSAATGDVPRPDSQPPAKPVPDDPGVPVPRKPVTPSGGAWAALAGLVAAAVAGVLKWLGVI